MRRIFGVSPMPNSTTATGTRAVAGSERPNMQNRVQGLRDHRHSSQQRAECDADDGGDEEPGEHPPEARHDVGHHVVRPVLPEGVEDLDSGGKNGDGLFADVTHQATMMTMGRISEMSGPNRAVQRLREAVVMPRVVVVMRASPGMRVPVQLSALDELQRPVDRQPDGARSPGSRRTSGEHPVGRVGRQIPAGSSTAEMICTATTTRRA